MTDRDKHVNIIKYTINYGCYRVCSTSHWVANIKTLSFEDYSEFFKIQKGFEKKIFSPKSDQAVKVNFIQIYFCLFPLKRREPLL